MKYCFIINPASGKKETKDGLSQKIEERAIARGLDVCVMTTEKAGDAKEYVISFYNSNKGEDIRFYVCGGDGSLCEAVNGVMQLEDRSRVSLGVIPVGTGNDFVRNFTNGEDFFDIDAQLDAKRMEIDGLRCNDFYAVNMINIGFDCQVVVRTASFKRRKFVPSRLAYIFGLVVTLVKQPGVNIGVQSDDGETIKKQLLLTTFANGCFCGGGFHSNPEATLIDGKINALFVNNVSRRKFVSLVGQYKKGTHLAGQYSDILSSEKAGEYHLTFDEPTQISVDGEIVTVERADISCVSRGLGILIPCGSQYAGAEQESLASV